MVQDAALQVSNAAPSFMGDGVTYSVHYHIRSSNGSSSPIVKSHARAVPPYAQRRLCGCRVTCDTAFEVLNVFHVQMLLILYPNVDNLLLHASGV